MNKFLQWIIGISVIVLVVTIAISTLAPVFVPSLRGTAFVMPQQGMMGGGFQMPFFGLGMFLWPALLIGAIVWGLTRFTREANSPAPATTTTPCAHCTQPLQTGWKACPYCGEKTQ